MGVNILNTLGDWARYIAIQTKITKIRSSVAEPYDFGAAPAPT